MNPLIMFCFINGLTFISFLGVLGEKNNESLRICLTKIVCLGMILLTLSTILWVI